MSIKRQSLLICYEASYFGSPGIPGESYFSIAEPLTSKVVRELKSEIFEDFISANTISNYELKITITNIIRLEG